MDFRAHFQQELDYLLEVGRSFSSVHSQASHLAERSGDPDVERLLEGFAFLTAKLHARLDQAQPALAQSLAEYLAPQHLRPIPSCTMVELEAGMSGATPLQEVPAGTQLQSRKQHAHLVTFETTQPVHLFPARVVQAQTKGRTGRSSCLTLEIETTTSGREALRKLGHLDFYIHAESTAACDLTMALARHCSRVEVFDYNNAPTETRPSDGRIRRRSLTQPRLELLGFGNQTPLLPWGEMALVSHRLLAEYQTLPEKFRQIRLHGLSGINLADDRLAFVFELDCPAELPGQVSKDNIRLFTVPARNIFSVPADPMRLDALGSAQRLRAANLRLNAFEVYDVASVQLATQGQVQHSEIPAFFDFPSGPPSDNAPRYTLERRSSPVDQHLDTFLRLHNHDKLRYRSGDTLCVDLRCTNRALAQGLKVGDLQAAGGFARMTNVSVPTQPCAPPLEAKLLWRLHASIALNRCTLTQATHLRALFSLYNHQERLRNAQALANTHLAQALRDAKAKSMTRLIKGAPVRGIQSDIELDQRNLSDGQAYMLGALINEILAANTCLNSVHATRVHLYPSGHRLAWEPRSGSRFLGA